MSKDSPAHRLAAAADLLGAQQVSMRPDLDEKLADWLRYEAETLTEDPSDYCGGEIDYHGVECGSWFCGTIARTRDSLTLHGFAAWDNTAQDWLLTEAGKAVAKWCVKP